MCKLLEYTFFFIIIFKIKSVFRFENSTFESNINHTNDLYGGFDPAVTHVYFTHGSLDPWHRMGVLKDLNKHSPSTVIQG